MRMEPRNTDTHTLRVTCINAQHTCTISTKRTHARTPHAYTHPGDHTCNPQYLQIDQKKPMAFPPCLCWTLCDGFRNSQIQVSGPNMMTNLPFLFWKRRDRESTSNSNRKPFNIVQNCQKVVFRNQKKNRKNDIFLAAGSSKKKLLKSERKKSRKDCEYLKATFTRNLL